MISGFNQSKRFFQFASWRSRIRYDFSGLPASYLRPRDSRNTEILSLSIEQTDQLMSLNTYNQSLDYLSKDNLAESLMYLNFALTEAKSQFPYSMNLQGCLMNRRSILQKLLNKLKDFQDSLEQVYLITLSAKGRSNLGTVKSLINYLIALTIYNPMKCGKVIEYLKNQHELPDYLLFFDGLNDIRTKKQYGLGIEKMKRLPEDTSDEKIFKHNNIGFLKVHTLRQQFKHPAQYLVELRKQSEDILSYFLKGLIEAENSPELVAEYSEEQIKLSEELISNISAYLAKTVRSLPTSAHTAQRILKHSNSHIIAMNIASLLFELERVKQSFYFLQLSLDKAVSQSELQRVGMALILLGRCYFHQQNDKWQGVYLDILRHARTYPRFVVKQALSSYSRLLFQLGRLYQAQGYLNQALSIESESGLEGLILPSYDFSF